MKISFEYRKDWTWIIVLTIIGLLPNIFLAIYGSDLNGLFIKTTVFLVISVILFFIPSLFFKARTFFLIQGIFVLMAPLEIAHIYLSRMPVTKAFMISVLNTNFHESIELLSSLKPFVFICLIIWILYFYIAIRKIGNTYIIPPLKIRLSLLAGVFLVFTSAYGYYYIFYTKNLPPSSAIYEVNRIFKWKFNKIYPYNLIFSTNYVLKQNREINKSREILKNVSFNAKKRNETKDKEVYIIVIGETARYANFSINGYERKTSPELEKTENLISFSDFYSEASLTVLSLPTLLTNTTAQDFDEFYHKKSFVDAFSEAGFQTYWFANQSSENGFIKRIAEDTDEFFFSTVDYDADSNYDILLWPYLDNILSKNQNKTLIILHTMGSHFKYNFRYPPEYNIFQPSIVGNFDSSLQNPKNRELLLNTYDNSILYTDYFLSQTISKLDSLNCISSLLYVSDHGENIFDTEEKIFAHGGKITTRYDYHVPLFIWLSDKYTTVYPHKTFNMIQNKDKKISMSYLFHTILDMADIMYPEQNLNKSIASDSLKTDMVRYVLHTDYTVVEAPN